MVTSAATRSSETRPRILVTGFSVFPGAPVNPTETLIERLRADSGALAALGHVRTEILAVEYDGLQSRLEHIAIGFAPDIAIHFGLSARARGFTLERLARNEIAKGRPDNAGKQPASLSIVPDGADLDSTLPLAAIYHALTDKELPVSWSDDAGGYLCNYLFYISRARTCAGFAPGMSGFVHVPPLDEGQGANRDALTLDQLVEGAEIIVGTCAAAWRAQRWN